MKRPIHLLLALGIAAFALPSLAESEAEVEIKTQGTNATAVCYLHNNSSSMRYDVELEIVRLDAKSGQVISKRTTRQDLAPGSTVYLGPRMERSIEIQYRIIRFDTDEEILRARRKMFFGSRYR